MLRGRVDPKKEEQDRLQGFLLEMLKEEENKYCADCQAKTPRWAAWNLGIFICIRCAGIHRNLGVHISKVRSVNLDSWTAEQVQTMRVMGNEKARQVYEHDLPPQFRRPTSDAQMEQFIRSKYEQKRYIIRDFVYPRVDVSELPKSFANLGAKKVSHPVVNISTKGSSTSNGSASTASSGVVNDLLDFSAPPPASNNSSKNSGANIMDDFAGLSIQQPTVAVSNTASDDFDDFGSFVSASAAPNASDSTGFASFSTAPSVSAPVESSNLADLSFPVNSSAENGSEQKKSNADIMSLFGGSSSSTSTATAPQPVLVAPGGFTAFGLQAAQPTNNSFAAFGNPAPPPPQNDMFGGLSGINFGSTAQPSAVPNLQFSGQNMMAKQQVPQSPTTAQSATGFNIPNKSNAFADLALGKVMKTTYGQNALQANPPSTSARTSPAPSNPIMSMPTTASNDLFDMFASVPPAQVPVTVNAPASTGSGLDDLLGL